MERVPEPDLDPGEDGTYWTRNDEPFTGVVFAMFEGRLSGEWECRDGFLWGPERHYDEEGLLYEAKYHIAGHLHGFRRWWDLGGKYVLEEYRFGVKLRGRWWKPDGTVETEDRTVGPEAENTVRYLAEYQQYVTDLGGDPSEVPEQYLVLRPGEWDDPPDPGDADRWLARFPAEPGVTPDRAG